MPECSFRKRRRLLPLLLAAVLLPCFLLTSCFQEAAPEPTPDEIADAEADKLLKSILFPEEEEAAPLSDPAEDPAPMSDAAEEEFSAFETVEAAEELIRTVPADAEIPFDTDPVGITVQETEPEPQAEPEPEPEPVSEEELHPEWEPEFYDCGLFLYGNAVYPQPFYHAGNSAAYLSAVKYYKDLFGADTRVSALVSPIATMVIGSEKVQSRLMDNKTILDQMKALADPSVNFVDAYTEMAAHRKEYLFFRSDHHWTARGAYYAYCAFIRSVGMEPVPLNSFEKTICTDDYHGSMYSFTQDPRVLEIADTIELYHPTKPLTMTITTTWGSTDTYTSLFTDSPTYVTFLSGDNPLTVISVPDNPQDKTILVLKDSFGNAFVPFLCEHYGTIYVVDVRYSAFNLYDMFGGSNLTDILFVNNLEQANTYVWSQMFMSAVGVTLY